MSEYTAGQAVVCTRRAPSGTTEHHGTFVQVSPGTTGDFLVVQIREGLCKSFRPVNVRPAS